MNSKLFASMCRLSLGGFLCVVTAAADTLTERNATHYGKLFAITPLAVVFDQSCNSEQRVTIPLDKFVSIWFDDQCEPPKYTRMPSSPLTMPCPGQQETLYTVNFEERRGWAREVETTKSAELKVTPYEAEGALAGPLPDVKSILYGSVCLAWISPSQWPDSFHHLYKKKRPPVK